MAYAWWPTWQESVLRDSTEGRDIIDCPVTSTSPVAEVRAPGQRHFSGAVPACILLCVLIFYWTPLVHRSTSIQGDTVDLYYPLQKYFSERLLTRHLPFWTPYLSSGYPILSSPYMAAWYPLNWPFYLLGATPFTMQLEIALHAALACLGMYFLLMRILGRRAAALFGSFAYGLSGYFTVYSAHVGAVAAAAWFPWLLLAYRRATEKEKLRSCALGAIAGAMMLLSGDPEVAAFGFVGLALFAAGDAVSHAVPWRRALALAIAILLGASSLAAIELVPAMVNGRYVRGLPAAALTSGDNVLHARPLLTLLLPDATGIISRKPQPMGAPGYFYAGVLLVPLAALGLIVSRRRTSIILVAVPAAWLMLGPGAGLYRLLAWVPWLGSGPPIFGWFLVSFALATAAAAGCDWMIGRGGRVGAMAVLAAGLLFADLWYWNSSANPLAYARKSYDSLFREPQALAMRVLAEPLLPLTRFESPYPLRGVGPLLNPLDMKFEVTYSYVLPESVYYSEYREAMRANPRLRDGLNVSRFLNLHTMQLEVNEGVLSRAYFPHAVREVASDRESLSALATLDPAKDSIVLAPHPPIEQDLAADAVITQFNEQSYRVHYTAQSPSLLKLSVPWYRGWHATIGRQPLPILRVDHALMGVVVPPGESDVEFSFLPYFFYAGAAFSALACLLLGLIAVGGPISRALDRMLFRDSGWKRKRRRLERRASI